MSVDPATVRLADCRPGSSVGALVRDELAYWLGWPLRWGRQMVRNGHDILRVLDIVRFRPMPGGLVGLDHPWVTGIDPATSREIWADNVLYRSPRADRSEDLAEDDVVLAANGRSSPTGSVSRRSLPSCRSARSGGCRTPSTTSTARPTTTAGSSC